VSDDARDIYCASKPGWPGFVAATVDDTDDKKHKKWVADTLRDWIRSGYKVVGKFTRAESVAGLGEYADERKRRAQNPQSVPGLPLFADVKP